MMALFIVLWLLNTSKKIQRGGGWLLPAIPAACSTKSGLRTNPASGENFRSSVRTNMSKLKEQLQRSIRNINDLEKLQEEH